LARELRQLVVVIECATEVDDPEDEQEQEWRDERELDERRPPLIAAERA
jgi:hypothetical protein